MIQKKDLYKSPVVFDKDAHTYTLMGKRLNGVTSTLLKRAFPDKYKGVPEAILKKAAQRGSIIHENIEFHDVFKAEADNDILRNYDLLKMENGLTPIANEYLVSDEKRYASSIDVVFRNIDGTISLADIKTTYTFDKESVSLQLSIYKMFFEASNPEIKVEHLYCIWIHSGEAKLIEVPVVNDATIKALIDADCKGKEFKYKTNPKWFGKLGERLDALVKQKDSIECEIDEIRTLLLERMGNDNISQLKTSFLTISYIQPSKRTRFDAKKFQKDEKELYDRYLSSVMVKPSLKIKVNEK